MNAFRYGSHDLRRGWLTSGEEVWAVEDIAAAISNNPRPLRYWKKATSKLGDAPKTMMTKQKVEVITRSGLSDILPRLKTRRAAALAKWVQDLPSERILKLVEEEMKRNDAGEIGHRRERVAPKAMASGQDRAGGDDKAGRKP